MISRYLSSVLSIKRTPAGFQKKELKISLVAKRKERYKEDRGDDSTAPEGEEDV